MNAVPCRVPVGNGFFTVEFILSLINKTDLAIQLGKGTIIVGIILTMARSIYGCIKAKKKRGMTGFPSLSQT